MHADTRFRLRYRVDRPGTGQFLTVIRPDPPTSKNSFVLLAPVPFAPTADGGWQTITFGVADWVPEHQAPDYPYPWVAFLAIANTYEVDLGLRVAEFTVTRSEFDAH